MQRLIRLAFWLAVAFTFVMATLPKPPQLPGDPSDKVLHILAFTCLTALGSAAYRNAGVLRLALGLAAFGAMIEVTQAIPALNRDAELLDWLADMTAVGAALLVLLAWRRIRRQR